MPSLAIRDSKIAQYIFLTAWHKQGFKIDLEGCLATVKAERDRPWERFVLGDPNYIDLYLAYFPIFDGCFLLQTSDPAPKLQPKAREQARLEAIPEEETTDAECESRQRSRAQSSLPTPCSEKRHDEPAMSVLDYYEGPEYSYFDF